MANIGYNSALSLCLIQYSVSVYWLDFYVEILRIYHAEIIAVAVTNKRTKVTFINTL